MAEKERSGGDTPRNPVDPGMELEEPSNPDGINSVVHPQAVTAAEDSAITKAEKYERHGIGGGAEESPSKKRKLDVKLDNGSHGLSNSERRKGEAPIKAE